MRARNSCFAALVCLLLIRPAYAGKNDDLLAAVKSKDWPAAKSLVDKGADPKAKDSDGISALHWAAREGNADFIGSLISKGAEVDGKLKIDGATPLVWAVYAGHPEVVKLLIGHGARVDWTYKGNAQMQDGSLLHAAAGRNSEIVRLLLDAGHAADVKNSTGKTPLFWAASSGNIPAIDVLVARGADVDARSNSGLTPLHDAYDSNELDAADALLARGADINAVSGTGTILSKVVEKQAADMLSLMRMLISKGADVNLADRNGDTPLYVAARRNLSEAAGILLGAGAKPDVVCHSAETPRQLFAKHGVKNLEELMPFATRVNLFVQSRLDAWMKKDEFETKADYDARMKLKKRKAAELMGEAFEHFGVWKSVSIGLYDAESGTFKLTIRQIGDIIMPVSKERAREFKQNFASYTHQAEFAQSATGWSLSRLKMIPPGGADPFVYDAARQASYLPVVFDVKMGGKGVDTSFASAREIKTATKRVTLAAADDVDVIPRFSAAARDHDVAVVIGVESYRGLPKSAYSRGDAELMKKYLIALGYRERNVSLLLDGQATYIDIKKTLETWLRNVAKPDSTVFVYYSGHGAPDPASGESYIVPFDGDPEYLGDTAYPLKKLVAGLNALAIKEAVLVLDSCFSGVGGRSVLAKNARPLVAKAQGPVLNDNVAMLSASGSDQVSTSSEDFGHGVFTYYFLKAFKEGKRDLADVYSYLRPLVEDEARRQNARQTPTMSPSAEKSKGRFSLVK
ncbi:MAG: ankyrin repeat domain-containing protein [Elusimicrobia bacterium]|nr:ankyrin repeat domain-containing protein [Elusimicrobiota bacterium]